MYPCQEKKGSFWRKRGKSPAMAKACGRTTGESATTPTRTKAASMLAIVARILVARHLNTADDLFGGPQGSPRTDKLITASMQWGSGLCERLVALSELAPQFWCGPSPAPTRSALQMPRGTNSH